MKIVVIGGSGLIGKKLVKILSQNGHNVLSASPSSGVNAVTGEGLKEALSGADIVVDVANSPSFEDKAVLEFFEKSGQNLLAAEKAAGVKHHVALSVVGTDRMLESGYFRAKMAQEKLILDSGLPYTIVRATQFFEFLGGIADFSTEGQNVKLSPAHLQPIASDDVAEQMAKFSLAPAVNGIAEIAGPERTGLSTFVQCYLKSKNDSRTVIADNDALYYGVKLNDQSLTPGPNAVITATTFDKFLSQSMGALSTNS